MRKKYIAPTIEVMELEVESMMAFSIDSNTTTSVSDNNEDVGARESVFDYDF